MTEYKGEYEDICFFVTPLNKLKRMVYNFLNGIISH